MSGNKVCKRRVGGFQAVLQGLPLEPGEALLVVCWHYGHLHVLCPECAVEARAADEEGGAWVAWKKDEMGEKVCPDCGGKGAVRLRVAGPDGSERAAAETDCPRCEGLGFIDCPACQGRGWMEWAEAQDWVFRRAEEHRRTLARAEEGPARE
jgi:hypothetical protein